MDDPYDNEWKVVRYKDPRSRRVIDALSEGSASAPGRLNATRNLQRARRDDILPPDLQPEPVLQADVEHVMAHEEDNDDAAYLEVDHRDLADDEPEEGPVGVEDPAMAMDDPIDNA